MKRSQGKRKSEKGRMKAELDLRVRFSRRGSASFNATAGAPSFPGTPCDRSVDANDRQFLAAMLESSTWQLKQTPQP
jgi:hypothetical protein